MGSSAVLEETTLTLGGRIWGPPHTPKWAEKAALLLVAACFLRPDGDYEGRSSEDEASAPLSVVPCRRRHGCTTAGRLQASVWLGARQPRHGREWGL